MVFSTCFVPGCTTGNRVDRKNAKCEGRKIKTLFKAPRDKDLFEKWKCVIPQTEREFTSVDVVCELHFSENVIDRFYVTRLSDGTIDKFEKGRVTLKPDAVPSDFPKVPDSFLNTPKKRKLSPELSTVVDIKKEVSDSDEQGECEEMDDELLISRQTFIDLPSANIFSFLHLSSNFRAVPLPSEWWGGVSTFDFLIWAKWTTNYIPERRVVIEKDLHVKIFLKDSEIVLPNPRKVSCMTDVTDLLKEVDELIFCAGHQLMLGSKCSIYLPKKTDARGRYSAFCKSCRIMKKNRAKAQKRKQASKETSKYKTLCQRLVSEQKRNAHLKKEVESLHEKVAVLKKDCAFIKTEVVEETITTLSPT